MTTVDLWTGPKPLILASQSASRKMLLANAGFVFEKQPADLDERALQDDSGLRDPGAIAGLLARAKAAHVAKRNPGKYVIGADQTLALGKRLFSKPVGRAQAVDQFACCPVALISFIPRLPLRVMMKFCSRRFALRA